MTTPTKARPSAKPAIDEEQLLEGGISPLIALVAFGARVVSRAVTRVRVEGDLSAIPRRDHSRETPTAWIATGTLTSAQSSKAAPSFIGKFRSPSWKS